MDQNGSRRTSSSRQQSVPRNAACGDTHDVDTRDREIARRILEAGVRRLLEAYEDAGMRGLCGSGRFEVAVDALRNLDLEHVLSEQQTDLAPGGSSAQAASDDLQSGRRPI